MNYRRKFGLACLVSAMAVSLLACSENNNHGSADTPIPTPKGECGNGVVEENETCDDGNAISGDGCSDSCQVEPGYECLREGEACRKKEETPDKPDKPDKPNPNPGGVACGNGVLEPSNDETCDDGNLISGDGCSDSCQVEPGYDCSSGTCVLIEPDELCGNGVVDDGEVCDDGNTTSGDGCASNCLFVEPGFACPKNGGACSKSEESVCGDGIWMSNEACEDGNLEDGDGCSATCTVELGYECTREQGCKTICGDGLKMGDEECDDGNLNEGDGCSSACTIEAGFVCKHDYGFSTCDIMRCGDGIVSPEIGEECEPEGIEPDYGYSNTQKRPYCRPGTLNQATGLIEGGCVYVPYCGDGIVQADKGETCDEGLIDEDGYPIGGTGEYGGCQADCRFAGRCGDGILNHGEACDEGENKTEGCSDDCKEVTIGWACKEQGKACEPLACGNHILEPELGEKCDDGNYVAGDGCFNCRVEQGYMCQDSTPPCPDKWCKDKGKYCEKISVLLGDGVVNPDFEECDDGNTIDHDGCTQGVIDPGYICSTPGKPCRAAACGDGIVAYGEECDDGNTTSGDGCSSRCKLEAGYRCDVPGAPCKSGKCGDGIVQAGEECDDGNTASGDGCSSICKIESGYRCKKDGGPCIEDPCGNGKFNEDPSYVSYKTCDDGNTTSGDGCSKECKVEFGYACDPLTGRNCKPGVCGDGIIQVGEECDDGNTMPNDGCDPKCKREPIYECLDNECTPVCGDGITMWMAGEECDDGNLVSGDGCSSECKIEYGFACTDFKSQALPKFIDIPVTYRSFRYWTHSGTTDGYMTSEFVNSQPTICQTGGLIVGRGFPDFQHYNGSGCQDILDPELDSDGKPIMREFFHSQGSQGTYSKDFASGYCKSHGSSSWDAQVKNQYTCPSLFPLWYRDVPGINKTFHHTLRLKLIDASTGKYQFQSSNPPEGATDVEGNALKSGGQFLPLGKKSYETGAFTTEIQTYFQYKGGETLDFLGDYDVWVFINNRIFVDLGGMQSSLSKQGTLAKDKCKLKDNAGNEKEVTCDKNFELYEGGIYEIKMFHAERQMGSSNFNLTLTGFLNTGKAECASTCGDGIIAADEQCDIKGHTNDATAKFNGCIECKKTAVCGNGLVEAGEGCDTGFLCNDTTYADICKANGITYKADPACNQTTCKYDSCGDGTLNAWEECDCKDGNCQFQPGFDSKASVCLVDTCKVAKCGDGIVTPAAGEECDNGEANGDNAACSSQCRIARCGDGIIQPFLGEVCDNGTDENGVSLNTGTYGKDGKPGCAMDCSFTLGYCGDGKIQSTEGEECDEGANNSDTAYNGCTTKCKLGMRCGDGITQKEFGESCDDGDKNGTPESKCTIYCSTRVN